jgi:hypothetical protein
VKTEPVLAIHGHKHFVCGGWVLVDTAQGRHVRCQTPLERQHSVWWIRLQLSTIFSCQSGVGWHSSSLASTDITTEGQQDSPAQARKTRGSLNLHKHTHYIYVCCHSCPSIPAMCMHKHTHCHTHTHTLMALTAVSARRVVHGPAAQWQASIRHPHNTEYQRCSLNVVLYCQLQGRKIPSSPSAQTCAQLTAVGWPLGPSV